GRDVADLGGGHVHSFALLSAASVIGSRNPLAQPFARSGTHGRLGWRVMFLSGIERAGGFYHKIGRRNRQPQAGRGRAIRPSLCYLIATVSFRLLKEPHVSHE